jgi:endosialidase-like protein
MLRRHFALSVSFLIICYAVRVLPQIQAAAGSNVVPALVKFSGVLTDGSGKPLAGTVGVTFSLYKDEQGGSPLWLETQSVQPDKSGRYSVMLGSTTSQGLPGDLFISGEARWVGVQAQGQPEQPRVSLPSVPYAMKAQDAQTIGGLPPSAFVLAAPPNSGSSSPAYPGVKASGNPPLGGSGTANYIAIWTDSTGDLGNSVLFQSGSGSKAKVGIGTTKPASTLDVHGSGTVRGPFSLPASGTATASAGFNSQPIDQVTSVFNSGTSTAVPQTFQWQAEPVGNNTSNATGSLNLLFGQGTNKPSETGLNIASNGQITFATGQTFPGTGTVTSVGSGAGLTGGPITGSGSLSIAIGGVSNAMLTNPSLTVTAGTDLTGGGSVALGGTTTLNLDTTKVPQLAANNTFTGTQTVNGNLSATGFVSGSAFQIGSNLFAFGSYANGNAFLGFAGTTSTTGTWNTATGYQALASNTTGLDNTAAGYENLLANTTGSENTSTGLRALQLNTAGNSNTADGVGALADNTTGSGNTASGLEPLFSNTTGEFNTAGGYQALEYNTTGSNNTALGLYAGNSTNQAATTGSNDTFIGANANLGIQTVLNNATAIGANAQVTASNSLVLGSINGVNGATANTNVGIGTTAPAYSLDVHGTGNFTGLIQFASGQTFPGTGTVTSVGSGTGLTGGPITGSGTLSIAPAACGTGNALTALPFTCSAFATLGANTFTGSQTVNGNLSATGVVTGNSYQIGSNVFAFGNYANENALLGFAGNMTMTGTANTASGYDALYNNTGGSINTAIGEGALYSNTTGHANTASGFSALFNNTGDTNGNASYNTAYGEAALSFNTTGNFNTGTGDAAGVTADTSEVIGSNNTFLGANTSMSTGTLNNATAIGANAEVAASNSMVLGSINGVYNATASTNVGIGITAPTYLLHIGNAGGANYNQFLRVEGPTQENTGTWATSFGGYGNFAIDWPGSAGGRFYVLENGIVGIGCKNPCGRGILAIGQGLGPAIADGWNIYSSRRWKTHIHQLQGALSKVQQLRGVSYDLKRSGKHEIGVIAEEVGKVVPEVVSYEENGKDAQGVDYSRLTALLIEAVKEQQRDIASQRAQITRLRYQLTQLDQNVRGMKQARTASARTTTGRTIVAKAQF